MSIVDEYLSTREPAQRSELERIRTIVKQTVPEAVEGIGYGMPVFKYNGKYLIGFAGFKDHMSIFPGDMPVASLKKKLEGHVLSKGTIQFTLENPLSESVLKEILAISLASIDTK